MDNTFKIIFTVVFEALFVYNAAALVSGLIRLKKSGAEILAEKTVWLRIWALSALSLIAQIGFFCTLTGPNYYILSMVSCFAVLYPNVMASECVFAHKGEEVWFGFKAYRKGAVKPGISQQRRGSLNVLMDVKPSGGKPAKQFVLKTTPALWEEIRKYL